MNVCMLAWSYWPVPTGGAEGQCRKLSHSLANRNVHCIVLTARLQLGTPSREMDGLVDIVRIPVPQMWIDPIIAWRDRRKSQQKNKDKATISASFHKEISLAKVSFIAKMVRWANCLAFIICATAWLCRHRREIDILHVHYTDWIAGHGGWIGNYLGIPVVCKVANMPVFPKTDISIPFGGVWDVWRRKTHYIAMHDAIEDELVEESVPREMIFRIPNGVEVPAGKAEPAHGEHVLFVGNFTQGAAHKGFDVLFKAWSEVCLQFPDARLVMAGHGDFTIWRSMVEQLGCSSKVHFAGYVPCMDDLYRKAALFVLPSRHEGMSNALLEAQAWGIPAVVSDIPGNRSVLVDGVTGIIVPVGDHSALANAICDLLNNPEARAEMGASARLRIEKIFCMAQVSDKYKTVYADLSKGKEEDI